MPIGVALGFIYGEEITTLLGGWQWPFRIEAVIMLPFVILAIFTDKSPSLSKESADKPAEPLSLGQQLKQLAVNPVFICIVLGQCAYVFTVGGLAFWGNNYLVVRYAVEPANAVMLFGLVTVGCGLLGTLMGSVVLDCILKKYDPGHPAIDVFRTQEGCKQMFFAVLFSTLCAVLGALSDSLGVFVGLLAAAEFLIFMTVGPQGVALMTCVDEKLRSQANAISVFFMHLLGDFPSPFFIGWMNDTIGVQTAMLVLVGWLLWSWIFWFLGWQSAGKERKPSQNGSLYCCLC